MYRTPIIIILIFFFLADNSIAQNSSTKTDSYPRNTEHVLFTAKDSKYRIAVSNNASESEQWAAKELQYWLKEISGVELPIQPVEQDYQGPQIVVGYNLWRKAKRLHVWCYGFP